MKSAPSVAASLSPEVRKTIAIQALSKSEPISHLAAELQVSRKFVYQQANQAQQVLDESFAPSPDDQEVLFHLPITKAWLFQFILALVPICHCSYRGVVELFRDLFDLHISVSTIHNRLQTAAASAMKINQSQDLSTIEVGLHDEIYQGAQPVLAGVDAASTYCYLLQGVETRDEDTWGWYLLESMEQGFQPCYTIADGGAALRAGQKAVMPEIDCHGDVFHIQQQFATVANSLSRQAKGATNRRRELEQQIAKARLTHRVTRQMNSRLVHAKQRERRLVPLAQDLKILLQWLCHDVLELAGPSLEVRQELFDFIVVELQKLEGKQHPTIRTLRKSLRKQRGDLLAFAGVLDGKLAAIAQRFDLPLQTVREVCLLYRKQPTSQAYWERWNQLHRELSRRFHPLMEAVAIWLCYPTT
ncbi:hypothetical protein [Synechococcus sp. PCC 7336]|uniref:hypothetical protein n=1 Tax=Synechococcus sp. PCC 7336 TaxID=195250 RepID=UPI00034DECB7|nr:hypothetical protein [Synechococcus sp. PCC 7336]